MLRCLSLSLDTFPEKLTTKNIEQQKRIQYFTRNPFTPEISFATRGDGWFSSAGKAQKKEAETQWEREGGKGRHYRDSLMIKLVLLIFISAQVGVTLLQHLLTYDLEKINEKINYVARLWLHPEILPSCSAPPVSPSAADETSTKSWRCRRPAVKIVYHKHKIHKFVYLVNI